MIGHSSTYIQRGYQQVLTMTSAKDDEPARIGFELNKHPAFAVQVYGLQPVIARSGASNRQASHRPWRVPSSTSGTSRAKKKTRQASQIPCQHCYADDKPIKLWLKFYEIGADLKRTNLEFQSVSDHYTARLGVVESSIPFSCCVTPIGVQCQPHRTAPSNLSNWPPKRDSLILPLVEHLLILSYLVHVLSWHNGSHNKHRPFFYDRLIF